MNFTLGTAQLGMNYGMLSRGGKPSREQAVSIVKSALARGIKSFDTARDYGDAEEVLGEALAGTDKSSLEIVTKLDPLTSLSATATPDCVHAAVDKSISRSCDALKTDRLHTLLLHRWDHHHAREGVIWKRLLQLRAQGKVAVLGASVYEPGEVLEALQDPDIQHLQIPVNVLDWRWRAAAVDHALAARPDVVVHARSAFLQGVLVHTPDRWPIFADFNAYECVQKLESLATNFGRESVADLCLAYVCSQRWITGVVVGCETVAQLEEDLRLSQMPKLSGEQCEEVERTFSRTPEDLLNPTRWKVPAVTLRA